MKKSLLFFWFLSASALLILFYATREILFPFVFGLILAYLSAPLVKRIEEKGFSRLNATLTICIPLFCILFGLLFLLIPLLKTQVSHLIIDLPNLTAGLQHYIIQNLDSIQKYVPRKEWIALRHEVLDYLPNAVSWLLHFIKGILMNGLVIANLLLLLTIVPITTFYLMRDWELIRNSLQSLIPRSNYKDCITIFNEMDMRLSGFIRGQLIVSAILAIYYATALTIFDIEYNILLGVLTGFFTFIPYIGIMSGFISCLFVTLYQFGDWPHFLGLCFIFLVGQMLEGGVLLPRIMGKRVGLHPLWIIFALLAGGLLFGFVGLLLSIPLASILGVLIRFFKNKYTLSRIYREETT